SLLINSLWFMSHYQLPLAPPPPKLPPPPEKPPPEDPPPPPQPPPPPPPQPPPPPNHPPYFTRPLRRYTVPRAIRRMLPRIRISTTPQKSMTMQTPGLPL